MAGLAQLVVDAKAVEIIRGRYSTAIEITDNILIIVEKLCQRHRLLPILEYVESGVARTRSRSQFPRIMFDALSSR